MDASSKTLSIFVHLAIWADTAGATIVITSVAFAACPKVHIIVRIACYIVSSLPFVCFPFLNILACCKHTKWFYIESGDRQ